MDEVLENVILGVNDILRFLKLGYMSLEEFESSF